MTIFEGMGIEELLVLRRQLQNRIVGGQQIGVAVSPGMKHDFATMPKGELRQLLRDVNQALHELDPDTYTNPGGRRMKISTVYPGTVCTSTVEE